MGDNYLRGAEAGKAIGDTIATNTALKELDLSSPNGRACDAKFAQAFSVGLGTNGALTSLNMSDNQLGGYEHDDGEWMSDMTGIEALAAAIPTCK